MLALAEFTEQFTQRYNVAGGGPISEHFSFRLSGGYYEGDGYIKNRGFGSDYGEPDQISYSPQIRFKTDDIDVNFRWAHVEDRGTPRTQISLTNRDRSAPCADGSSDPGCTINPFYLDTTPNPALDPNCPIGLPGFRCGSIRNEVAVNSSGISDSEADQYFLSANFDVTDNFTLRYNYGHTDNFSRVTRGRDGTNRIASIADPTLSTDAGVRFDAQRLGVTYDYTETSHELQLLSNLDGPFNFITGIFFYENDTTWSVPRDDFSSAFRFTDANQAAAAASPFFGVPVSSCNDILTNVIVPFGIGSIDPLDNDGLYWTCAPGTDHTRTLLFTTNGKSDTRAVFFNMDYQLNEQWLVSGGLRYTEDEKRQGFDGGDITGAFLGGNVPFTLFFDDSDRQKRTWSRTIGHVSLEYTSSEDHLIYGRISTGYRAGGFNTFVLGSPDTPIQEETLINYELGFKGRLLENRLQLSAAMFYNDFEDYQLNATQANPVEFLLPTADTPLVEFTSNIPGSKLWGAELEFVYLINDQWRVSGFYNYLGSEIGEHASVLRGNPNPVFEDFEHIDTTTGMLTTSQFEAATDQTGNTLPQQPKHKLGLTAVYEHSLNEMGNLQLLTTYTFTDRRHADIGNLSIFEMPSYARWDVRATWTSASDEWAATLFVRNVADKIGVIEFLPESTNAATPAASTLTEPRQVGLQIRYRPNL
ncbi:MAG: TonB-dependent receptor [Pseudomonadota bacterium]